MEGYRNVIARGLSKGGGIYTARTRNSVSLLEVPRPRALDSALDQEVVSSVVVLMTNVISHGDCILIFSFHVFLATPLGEWNVVQLCEYPIKSCASTAGSGES